MKYLFLLVACILLVSGTLATMVLTDPTLITASVLIIAAMSGFFFYLAEKL